MAIGAHRRRAAFGSTTVRQAIRGRQPAAALGRAALLAAGIGLSGTAMAQEGPVIIGGDAPAVRTTVIGDPGLDVVINHAVLDSLGPAPVRAVPAVPTQPVAIVLLGTVAESPSHTPAGSRMT